jgi:hypothetical protein
MSFMSAIRSRTMSTLAMLALIGAALLSVPAYANADPYPPSGPSSGVAPTSIQRGGNTDSQTSETASTGFATLTATGIAIALLAGGIVLVVAGRRRRRA